MSTIGIKAAEFAEIKAALSKAQNSLESAGNIAASVKNNLDMEVKSKGHIESDISMVVKKTGSQAEKVGILKTLTTEALEGFREKDGKAVGKVSSATFNVKNISKKMGCSLTAIAVIASISTVRIGMLSMGGGVVRAFFSKLLLILKKIIEGNTKNKEKTPNSSQETTQNVPPAEPKKDIVATSVSKTGVKFVAKHEGCRLKAYKAIPSEKYYTIGYGHYGPDVTPDMTITKEQAEEMLAKDLARFEKYVRDTGLELNQNQFDALVSFTYNCGQGSLKMLIKNRTLEEIGEAMLLYTHAGKKELPGLVKRRKEEHDLFFAPV